MGISILAIESAKMELISQKLISPSETYSLQVAKTESHEAYDPIYFKLTLNREEGTVKFYFDIDGNFVILTKEV